MKLEREITAQVPLDRAWAWLADPDALTACLADGGLRKPEGERVYHGELTFGVNGSETRCRTAVHPLELDDDTRTTRLRVQGHEVGGAGLGVGTVEGRLTPDGDETTRIVLCADVAVTGHGASADALRSGGDALLEDFAKRLADRMQREPPPATPSWAAATRQPAAPERPSAPSGRPDGAATAADRAPDGAAADSGPAAAPAAGAGLLARLGRYGPLAGLALALALLLGRGARSRKGLSIEVRYRW